MSIPEPPEPEVDDSSRLVRKVAVAGVVMLVTPGPGIVTIAVGLGILGSEFQAPRRALNRLRRS